MHFELFLILGKYLLEKMQALETYPPPKWGKLVGKDDEYLHAKKYLEKNSSYGAKTIGTLSKSEWEAASKYRILF